MRESKRNHDEYNPESKLRMVIDGLSATFKSLTSSGSLFGDGEHPSLVADVARIGTALITALAEHRQLTRSRLRSLSEYGIDDLIANLRERTKREQEDVLSALTGDDRDRSLL